MLVEKLFRGSLAIQKSCVGCCFRQKPLVFLYIQMQFQYNIGLSVMFSSNFHAKSSCSIVYNFRSSNAVKLSYNNTMTIGYYSLLPEIICNILYLFRYPFKIFFFYSSSFPLFFIFIVYSTNSKILKRKTIVSEK